MDEEKAKRVSSKLYRWLVGDLSEDDIKRMSPTFTILCIIYGALIILSNCIAGKVWHIGGLIFPAAILTFPLVYVCSDAATEIWGFKLSLIPIKMNVLLNIFMSIIFAIAILLPPAPFWHNQEAMKAILGSTWRICFFSILGSFTGDYLNSVSLAAMKVWQKGKAFPVRSILSSVIGQVADTGIFITGAFAFTMPWSAIFTMMVCQYIAKILYEVVCLPITTKAVAWIKTFEGDYYDDIKFGTFKL